MKIRLFPKFLIVMLLVSLIPIVLLGNRLITMGQLGVKTALLELHLSTADKISHHFESFVLEFDKKALFITSSMKQMDWENKQILLSSFVQSNSEVKQISVISNKGSEVIKVVGAGLENKPQLSDYSKDEYLLKTVKNKKRVIQIDCDENSKDIVFYYPVLGKFVIRILVNMENVLEAVETSKVGQTGFAFVTDSKGIPILYPEDIAYILKKVGPILRIPLNRHRRYIFKVFLRLVQILHGDLVKRIHVEIFLRRDIGTMRIKESRCYKEGLISVFSNNLYSFCC